MKVGHEISASNRVCDECLGKPAQTGYPGRLCRRGNIERERASLVKVWGWGEHSRQKEEKSKVLEASESQKGSQLPWRTRVLVGGESDPVGLRKGRGLGGSVEWAVWQGLKFLFCARGHLTPSSETPASSRPWASLPPGQALPTSPCCLLRQPVLPPAHRAPTCWLNFSPCIPVLLRVGRSLCGLDEGRDEEEGDRAKCVCWHQNHSRSQCWKPSQVFRN